MTSPSDQMWNATTARPHSSTYPLPTLCSNGLEHTRISAFQLRWKAWTKQKGRIRSDAEPSASLQMRDGKLYVVPGSGYIRIHQDTGRWGSAVLGFGRWPSQSDLWSHSPKATPHPLLQRYTEA